MMQQAHPTMEYRNLGKSSIKVSVISFGNWLNADDAETRLRNKDIVKHAWDLGINFFDTAEGYAAGQAETQLGEALQELMKEKNVDRQDLVISTKIFFGTNKPGEAIPNSKYLSRKHIIEGLKASLKRLQLSYVDLVFAHRFDNETPMEEICRAWDWVVRKGLALYWGTSEWNSTQIIEAHGVCDRLGLIKPVMEQPQYSMLARDRFEVEYGILFDKYQMGTTIWSPLAQGILTGKYNHSLDVEGRLTSMKDNPVMQGVMKRWFASDEAKNNMMLKLQKLGDIAKELGCTQGQLAMAWVIKNKDVSTAITGVSSKAQLDESVKAVQIYKLITPELEKRIEEVLANKPTGQWTMMQFLPTRRDLFV